MTVVPDAPTPTDLPTPFDRGWAAAVHVASIPWPLIGPLVGWALFHRKSRYVASHAKQALLETIVLNLGLFIVGLASFCYTVVRVVHYFQTNWADFSWQEFLVRFLVGWILLALLQVFNVVWSVKQAVDAWRGKLPKRFATA
ncbi:MAG: DUF4870 domain-containing protein [Armatimonadetes bacterium]|nr:DUF4870 domain-containing protein [Armatimonadota bacterium]